MPATKKNDANGDVQEVVEAWERGRAQDDEGVEIDSVRVKPNREIRPDPESLRDVARQMRVGSQPTDLMPQMMAQKLERMAEVVEDNSKKRRTRKTKRLNHYMTREDFRDKVLRVLQE